MSDGDDEGDVLRVRVMDWITDTLSEQQTNIEMFQSFSRINHLEIRLTGWTINQESRLHVGINTVPAILGTMMMSSMSDNAIEELTIDLECLSRSSTLSTFCNLIASLSLSAGTTTQQNSTLLSLKKLTITCSGEEDISKYSLRELGLAFQSLNSSITTLKFSGMNPDHMAVILYNMQRTEKCCTMERCMLSCPSPCLSSSPCPSSCSDSSSSSSSPAPKRPCPRVLPQRSCDPYEPVPHQDDDDDPDEQDDQEAYHPAEEAEGYPKSLELQRIRLSHQTISNLTHLLLELDENSSSSSSSSCISHLTLRDCVLTSEDLGFLTYLLKGYSVLQELTLERLRIRTFRDAPAWWNGPCTRSVPSTTTSSKRLETVRLLDCKGSRKDLEAITDALVGYNPALQTLILQYSSSETCSMTIHALNALYLTTVVHNRGLTKLRQLQVSAGPHAQSYKLQQLATLLGHSQCHLEKLTLDFGAGPYHLDILADKLIDNSRLQHLSLSGDDESLDVATLECFITMLEDVPNLKTLELDFPGIHATDKQVLKVFRANTTLEDIRIVESSSSEGGGGGDNDNDTTTASSSSASRIHLGFFGLRNRLRNLLLSQHAWTIGTWKQVLHVLLKWQQEQQQDSSSRPKELIYTSAIWFALMECPLMISELGPLVEPRQQQQP